MRGRDSEATGRRIAIELVRGLPCIQRDDDVLPVSLTLALVALLLQDAAVPPGPDPDIVVVGERVRRLKLRTTTDRKTGTTLCVFKRRSGDPAFDTLMCDALLSCIKTVKTSAQLEACMGPPVAAYARSLKARRDALRAGGTP